MTRRLKTAMILLLAASCAATAHAAPVRKASITHKKIDQPVRVAVDAAGNLYVTETAQNRVLVFDALGRLNDQFHAQEPLGLAVDALGRVYVGSAGRHAVDVYAQDQAHPFTRVSSLGIGPGEVEKPNAIAIDGSGRVYVADSLGDVIKVYASTGNFSFDGAGIPEGKIRRPMGVAVSDAPAEVYVVDCPDIATPTGTTFGARVLVFDKQGGFKRSFGTFGDKAGQIASPSGVAVDKFGLLYVSDSYQGVVHILDPRTGAPVGSGALYDLTKPLAGPMGVAISKDGLAYVAYYKSGSIEVYALDGYATSSVAPTNLTFTARQYANPAAQNIDIANNGTGVLNWTASGDQSWLTLSQTSGSAPVGGASALSVGVNSSSLAPGTYTASVTINTDIGRTETVAVSLTVLPPATLSLSNGWLTFTAPSGKPAPAQSVTVGVQNVDSLSWSAVSDASWLAITPASGNVTKLATVSANTAGLAAGVYTGHIAFSAPGVNNVGLTVTLNITNASAGNPINPDTPTRAQKRNIIVAKGPASGSDSLVKAYKNTGAPAGFELLALESAYGANVASGDIDGDGTAELIVGSGEGPNNASLVRIYRADKAFVTEVAPYAGKGGVRVAAADLDGDGRAEIIVTPGSGAAGPLKVYGYNKTANALVPTGLEIHSPQAGLRVTAADFEGDARPELVTASCPASALGVWKVDVSGGLGAWAAGLEKELALGASSCAALSAGDVDGDGREEIIAGLSGQEAMVLIVAADGTQRSFPVGKGGVETAAADVDGDGLAEIVTASCPLSTDASDARSKTDVKDNKKRKDGREKEAGTASSAGTCGAVKVYGAAGNLLFTITPFEDAPAGVKVAVGEMGL